MTTLEQALGLTDLLDAAAACVPLWGLHHPDLGELLTVGDVVLGSRTGSLAARDKLLRELARLANRDAGDSPEAAALLCQLLVPGVVSKLSRARIMSLRTDEVMVVAAEHLWMQCRTFNWQGSSKVAPAVAWGVRRATLADFGICRVTRFDRTWAATLVVDNTELEPLLDRDPVEWAESPESRFLQLLNLAESSMVITRDQRQLLDIVVEVASQHGQRASTHGLMSREVSQQVGERLGVAASTVRRRFGDTLRVLREAVGRDSFLATGFC